MGDNPYVARNYNYKIQIPTYMYRKDFKIHLCLKKFCSKGLSNILYLI